MFLVFSWTLHTVFSVELEMLCFQSLVELDLFCFQSLVELDLLCFKSFIGHLMHLLQSMLYVFIVQN